MLYSRANLVASKVASNDLREVGLNALRLEHDGSSAATNGKVLMAVGPVDPARAKFPDVGEQIAPKAAGVSLTLEHVDKVLKNLPGTKTQLHYVAMTKCRIEQKVELTITDQQHTQRIEGYPKNEPYPDWREVLRQLRGTGGLKVCVNRKDLIDLLKAMEEACPDKGGENPVFMELHPEGNGLILRCFNRETGQRALGGIKPYKTGGQWLPATDWERSVLGIKSARKLTDVADAGTEESV